MCGANREMTDRATATHRVGKYRVLTSSFETCALPSLTVPVCWQPFLTYHRNVKKCIFIYWLVSGTIVWQGVTRMSMYSGFTAVRDDGGNSKSSESCADHLHPVPVRS